MTPQNAKKLKVGDAIMIGGDIRGFITRINRKSITFKQNDWWGIFNETTKWNLPYNGQWDDIEKGNLFIKPHGKDDPYRENFEICKEWLAMG